MHASNGKIKFGARSDQISHLLAVGISVCFSSLATSSWLYVFDFNASNWRIGFSVGFVEM